MVCAALCLILHTMCRAGRDRRAWLRHTPFLLAEGYSCLSFDFSDHGTSDRADGSNAAPRGTTLGLRESRDIIRVVDYSRKQFPGYKLALMGTSTGSVSSLIALATNAMVHDNIVCLVAENPFESIPVITWDTISNLIVFNIICKKRPVVFWLLSPLLALVAPMVVLKVVARLRAQAYFSTPSCLQAARRCRTPCFVMHGTDDDIVPVKHSKRIVADVPCVKVLSCWEGWCCCCYCCCAICEAPPCSSAGKYRF